MDEEAATEAKSIADSLSVPEGQPEALQSVVDASKDVFDELIDSIRAVADSIEVSSASLGGNMAGGFEPIRPVARITIDLDMAPGQLVATMVHEMGHGIDGGYVGALKGMPARKYYSMQASRNDDGPFADWWKAATKSKKYGELKKLSQSLALSAAVRQELKDYYLKPTELWARSFTQHVGTQSKNRRMGKEWAEVRKETFAKTTLHWDDDDFREIAKEVGKILDRL